MKNLMTEIKKCEQTKYKQSIMVEANHCNEKGTMNQWILLNLIEQMQEEPADCLSKIAPEYKKDLHQVSMRLYEEAKLDDKLEFEARFYEIDKRTVELKIFARKVRPDQTSKRVCRAAYRFKAVYDQEVA